MPSLEYALAAEPPKIPIILDTDIGTDIDDAFALALIIDSPEFELLGVTMNFCDTRARARIAAKMLWEAGGKWRQVPGSGRRSAADFPRFIKILRSVVIFQTQVRNQVLAPV